MYLVILYQHTNIFDRICENPPNRLLFHIEIEARKVDAVITD